MSEPPSDEAVKAAFDLAEFPNHDSGDKWREALNALTKITRGGHPYRDANRILAAHARAKEAEVAAAKSVLLQIHKKACACKSEQELAAELGRVLYSHRVMLCEIAREALAGKGEG